MMPVVYLAGPIAGSDWDEASVWRVLAREKIGNKGIICLSPLRGKAEMFSESKEKFKSSKYEGIAGDRCIFHRDRSDVERADILLVNLTNTTCVSIGTMFELAWASMLHKFIVVVMEEEDNLHDHAFVREAASLIVPTLDEACTYIIHTLQPLTKTR